MEWINGSHRAYTYLFIESPAFPGVPERTKEEPEASSEAGGSESTRERGYCRWVGTPWVHSPQRM